MNKEIIEFLKESNNIEDVWDEDSLTQAIYAWKYLVKNEKLTREVILKTHKILMLHQLMQPDERGYFRKRPVWIGGHEAKSYWEIKTLMENWIKEAMKPKIENEIKNDHILFEAIHPFIDGNGRIGRMLLNWQRIRAGRPVLVIKESEKSKYYKWFN